MWGWGDTDRTERKGRRHEPAFGGSESQLRADREDRIGGAPKSTSKNKSARGKKSRQEPRFADDSLRADQRRASPAKNKAALRVADDDFDDRETRGMSANRRADRRAKRPRRSFFGGLFYWSLVLSVWGLVGFVGLIAYYGAQLPPIDKLAIPKRPPNIAILGIDGEVLANRGDTGGPAIRLAELPPYLPKAFIAIEDRRFYSHWGIDPVGILRAVSRNVVGRGGMQGGSTLTQQLAKNLFLTQERTMSRKMQEAILALWLEHRYSKDQILELYLNRVYFGSGAYGVEAASQKYFGHNARAATLAEAAMLAGLMKAPTKLAPNRNPVGASERAAQVITAMAQEGHISEAMAQVALSHSAHVAKDAGAASINYAADYVMDVLDGTIGAIDEDLIVSTTLSGAMQKAAEAALTDELDRKGAKFNVSQGALVSLDPNGAIRALVGGRNYSDSQFNRAVAAKRQPGSAFKPFVYLSALEKGLTPDTVREDGPINVKGWQPENYSREYFGPVTLTNALALSLNTVAVRLGMEVGPKTVAKTAHRLGIASELQVNASISLGTSEVTPLELVTAYAPFANGGVGVQAHVITKVRTADGRLLYQRRATSNGRLIEPHYVSMMNAMMQETLLTGTARKAELPGWQAAGKTGTSQDFRDAWFVGYTSQLITGVWLGNDDNSPTKKASGGNLPVEIWSRYMKEALRGAPIAALPGGTWRPAAASPSLLDNIFQGSEPSGQPATTASPVARPAPAGPNPGASSPNLGAGATGSLRSNQQISSRASAPRSRADLVPPADIPGDGLDEALAPPAAQEKNFLEKLFGG